MTLDLPDTLTIPQRAMCYEAALDGFRCGVAGGYQEQNPYSLCSENVLFESWRTGWFYGIDEMTDEVRTRAVPSNLPSVLQRQWLTILRRP